jgi:tRNA 2-thiouridine synthesizing protein A
MTDQPTWDAEIDAIGLLCPLPVLRASKRLRALQPGAVLRVLADDPAARIDMPHFCAEQGHDLIQASDPDPAGVSAYLIRHGGRSTSA